ncbi:hypothetical protein SCG7086_BW_00060 [Chlamydiales bacterium SCGC AG-110-P3]|nr:hypothetical protein SCG7086_BW_00060 [Chlamydiales bacterium SCGC AG-110-P3]
MRLLKKRRNFLLIEVVVAMLLVTMVAVPLLRPSSAMLRIEMEAVRQLRLERKVGEVHVAIVEAMYRNEISWTEIEDGELHDIEVPHTARYKFSRDQYESKGDQYYKKTLTIIVPQKGGMDLKRSYMHFIEKKGTQ